MPECQTTAYVDTLLVLIDQHNHRHDCACVMEMLYVLSVTSCDILHTGGGLKYRIAGIFWKVKFSWFSWLRGAPRIFTHEIVPGCGLVYRDGQISFALVTWNTVTDMELIREKGRGEGDHSFLPQKLQLAWTRREGGFAPTKPTPLHIPYHGSLTSCS